MRGEDNGLVAGCLRPLVKPEYVVQRLLKAAPHLDRLFQDDAEAKRSHGSATFLAIE